MKWIILNKINIIKIENNNGKVIKAKSVNLRANGNPIN
jgi:hypothetical protein